MRNLCLSVDKDDIRFCRFGVKELTER